MSCIYPVILSGGVGSRLWPLSRSLFPKQLLALVGKQTLIQETALRAIGPQFAKISVVCQQAHRFLVAEQMRAIGVEPLNVFLEPVGRNTAPAAAVAALAILETDPDAILLLMPADHVIRDREAFRRAVDITQDLAKRGHLVTFGIHPNGAETGYGYVQRGTSLGEVAFAVSRFVEKPDADTARRYVEAGDYYWNSGMFAFRATTFLSELERLEPDIVMRCRSALSSGKKELDCFQLDPQSFEACKSISIDYAVMERTDKAAIVPVEMGWSDIGSWAALWETSDKDAEGNVVMGNILHHGARNSYLRSEGPLIAALGVEDLAVVASADAVLVGPKSAAQEVRKIVERLERERSELHIAHRKVQHPWGWSERINQGENFQVNCITLNSGAVLSQPPSSGWVGHWIVASGVAKVTLKDKVFRLSTNESCVLSGEGHRLENAGSAPLCIIEVRIGVQSGETGGGSFGP